MQVTNRIDAQITKAIEQLRVVPGISIAVYSEQGGYANAYGVLDVETQETATPSSAFYIASSTKSMVSVAMAALHERSEIDLDSSLSDFAPEANFPVSVKPDQVTLRHLLAQSSGLVNYPIQNRLAYSGQYTPELLWQLLSATEVNAEQPLGTFKYSNYNYNILTLLVEHKLNKSWKDILDDEMFRKMAMDRTSAYVSKAQHEQWSLARPHTTLGIGSPARLYLEKTDATMQSAGGVIMSANDALKWLELVIQRGSYKGLQIVPEKAVLATLQPQVEVNQTFAEYTREYYGLGWYIGQYQDKPFIHHFGGFAGTRAHVSFIPENNVGVAVFVNGNGVGFQFADIVANYLYAVIDDPQQANSQFEKDLQGLVDLRDDIQPKVIANMKKLDQRQWKLGLPFEKYRGRFSNALYGNFEVDYDNGELSFRMGNLHAVGAPYKTENSVRVELIPGSGEVVLFDVDNNGDVAGFQYQGHVFSRQ